MIVYNEAIDEDVMEILKDYNYTKIPSVLGKGKSSGIHAGDDIWPGKNNILFVACNTADINYLIPKIKMLYQKFKKEGIKTFVFKLEDTI